MAFDVVAEIQRAHAVAAPLIALCTADQQSTIVALGAKLGGDEKEYKVKYTPDKDDIVPVIGWNVLNGLRAFNKAAVELLPKYCAAQKGPMDDEAPDPKALKNIVKMLEFIQKMGEPIGNKEGIPTIIALENAHRFLEEIQVLQGIMNLREPFQANRCILLMLGPSFQLPSEITQDVLVLDEPLPTSEEIKGILEPIFEKNGVVLDKDTLPKASAALKGLAEFPIVQSAALSIHRIDGKLRVSVPDLWERKRKMIEQIPGLSMEKPGETFDQIGGLSQVKSFVDGLVHGPCCPTVIVWIDEIEKMVAGAGHGGLGDSSGTSQDQMQQILTSMEDYEWSGQINLGPPGSGKSLLAKAMAATYGIPLIRADFGAAKGGIVGESERKIRAMIKALYAMAGHGGAYFVATCNKLHTLSPELQRRFNLGMFFFDLPDQEERLSIGKIITTKKYPTVKDDPELWANAAGWSGANIRDCCKMAYAMNMTVDQAQRRVVPAYRRDMEGITNLRKMAHGKFLSASYEGEYDMERCNQQKEEEVVTAKPSRLMKIK